MSRKITVNSKPRSKRENKIVGLLASDFDKFRYRVTCPVFPAHYRCNHIYREQINFTGVTTPQIYVFRGNSPYDPNQTGTGSQPVGWDNLLTFFSSSFCVGSRITVGAYNTSNVPVQFALVPTYSSSDISSYDSALIYPGVKTMVIDGNSRGGQSFKSLTRTTSTLGFYRQNFDRDFIATGQDVSGKQWYWSIAIQTYDQATALGFTLQVTVDYDVVWLDRKYVTLS